MKITSNKLIIGVIASLMLGLVVYNSSAGEIPFTTSKTNRTLIKEIIVTQRETRSDQKKMLKLLKDIQKTLKQLEK